MSPKSHRRGFGLDRVQSLLCDAGRHPVVGAYGPREEKVHQGFPDLRVDSRDNSGVTPGSETHFDYAYGSYTNLFCAFSCIVSTLDAMHDMLRLEVKAP